ncbi:heavy-metal-associated domain-containing protein [Thermodesulfobacteriota bacterium]
MTNDRRFLNNKLIVFLILTILIVTVAVAFGYQLSKKETGTQVIENTRIDNSLSKLVLNVSDMSCSGCVSTIKGSLSDFEGIGDILVDVGRGRTEVYFDPGKLTDITRIEKAITESGYPAKIQKVVSADKKGDGHSFGKIQSLCSFCWRI